MISTTCWCMTDEDVNSKVLPDTEHILERFCPSYQPGFGLTFHSRTVGSKCDIKSGHRDLNLQVKLATEIWTKHWPAGVQNVKCPSRGISKSYDTHISSLFTKQNQTSYSPVQMLSQCLTSSFTKTVSRSIIFNNQELESWLGRLFKRVLCDILFFREKPVVQLPAMTLSSMSYSTWDSSTFPLSSAALY